MARLPTCNASGGIIIKSVKPDRGGSVSQGNTRILEYGITNDDLQRIENTIPKVVRVVPLREVSYRVSRKDKQYGAPVVGALPDFFETVKVPIAWGRPLVTHDNQSEASVCVIGDEIRKALFAHTDPLGQTLTVYSRSTGPVPFPPMRESAAIARRASQ